MEEICKEEANIFDVDDNDNVDEVIFHFIMQDEVLQSLSQRQIHYNYKSVNGTVYPKLENKLQA